MSACDSVILSGTYELFADIDRVWDELHSPAALTYCIPHCDSLERLDATQYQATFRAGISRLTIPIGARLEVVPLDPPRAYRLVSSFSLAILGKARGEADVTLAESVSGVMVSYTTRVSLSGGLAGYGSGLIENSIEKSMLSFFARMQHWLKEHR